MSSSYTCENQNQAFVGSVPGEKKNNSQLLVSFVCLGNEICYQSNINQQMVIGLSSRYSNLHSQGFEFDST